MPAGPRDPRRPRHRLGGGANRRSPPQLLAAADLWLFVTSAARYADQVPWGFLQERRRAEHRGRDRARPDPAGGGRGGQPPPRPDAHRAGAASDSPLFTVTEGAVDEDGLLPAERGRRDPALARDCWPPTPTPAPRRQADPRRRRPLAVASHPRRRRRRGEQVATGAPAARGRRPRLRRGGRRIDDASADGTLLRGEVLARWQEFVGTGELLRSLETRVGWLRDRVVGWVKGKPQQAERVTVAVESGLETLLLEHAEAAAERAEASWRSVDRGPAPARGRRPRPRPRLARLPVPRRAQRPRLAAGRARAGAHRGRRQAQHRPVPGLRRQRALGGADGGGLRVAPAASTGAEVGIAGGGAVLGQKLLEAVFGDQAVRRLAERGAQGPATVRVGELMDERARAVPRRARRPRASTERPSSGCATRRAASTTCGSPTAPPPGTGRTVDERARARARSGWSDGAPRSSTGSTALEQAARPRRGPRPARRRARRRGRRPSPTGPAPGCGSPATTPSSRWPGPPAPASPRRSTPSPGSTLAAVGVRRPTTSWTMACTWGDDGAAELLDWLGVPKRHQVLPRHACSTRGPGEDARARRAGAARPARPRLHRGRPPPRGRPAGEAGRPAGVGPRPAEVRRRGAARALPAAARHPPRHHARGAEPHRRGRRGPAREMLADLRRLLAEDGLETVPVHRHVGPRRRRHPRAHRRDRPAGRREEGRQGPADGRRRRGRAADAAPQRRRAAGRRGAGSEAPSWSARSPTPPASPPWCTPSSCPPGAARARRPAGRSPPG